jgi:hypothetical protein
VLCWLAHWLLLQAFEAFAALLTYKLFLHAMQLVEPLALVLLLCVLSLAEHLLLPVLLSVQQVSQHLSQWVLAAATAPGW